MVTELGPVSQAILDYVNWRAGDISLFRVINYAAGETGARHTESWYFRRLAALALEGHIMAVVHRDGDKLAFRFRRLPEAE